MMRAFRLQELAGVLGTAAPSANTRVERVVTDTRTLRQGDLFVALRGDRFDGHGFLEAAREAGAAAAVVDTTNPDSVLPQLVVPDTVQALADLARFNREQSRAGVVAITGSSGKTTLKEMLAAILLNEGETLATQGNLNNHIGAPLTLLRVAPEHRFAVIELGASGLGEIAHTVAAARPDVAVITNAGEAHLEGFGSYDNIVQAKGEIIDGLGASGTVVLNADDPAYRRWKQRAGARQVVSVSASGAESDYCCTGFESLGEGYRITVAIRGGRECQLEIALSGEHNISNALLAMAAAEALGASEASVRGGLAAVKTAAGRLERKVLSERVTVIDDSYNANPSSMKAALEVLAGAPATRVALLGAMAELGPGSAQLHQEVGTHARKLGVEQLLVVGAGSDCAALTTGFGDVARCFDTHEQAVDWLLEKVTGPLTVLVKGSRSSAMDQAVRLLQEKVGHSCCSG
ncbi:UDP-N-acetylmuramoyl-tripeptide--D-alanyl-D-alanine ligase [Marinobacter bryozoorum]|uniref:UDP-N-acetylmuramoyl-tripeptide--D-alanyl-D- alanine ligase n=1 Tax=Marinobacter bryozoorum TaxID=256324 RepID=UPI0020036389|nr:UDP-N-acetylmuramoyl-tripeptide--D-alanyl-D-alanine ligase [Marinobacter bryozoorum]MCK7543866.1 UDP-N-acetylmuramoyl-tripeptide--D-alanyl-D-alanine ligase [Marinobacter bryozoorum]